MTETVTVGRKELTSTEVLRELDGGNRVIIEVDVLGKTMRMAIRRRENTYYCDTPVKLLTYDSREEMRTCLERYRLAESVSKRPGDQPDAGSPETDRRSAESSDAAGEVDSGTEPTGPNSDGEPVD